MRTAMLAAIACSVFIVLAHAQEPASNPLESTIPGKPISLELARRIADAALAACAKRGHPITVLVLDQAGNTRILMTADNARKSGLDTASHKAAAVLAFGVSSKDLAVRVETDPAFSAKYGNDSRYNFHDGAIPLYIRSQMIGVLALGGAHGVDDQCAHDALAATPQVSSMPR